MVCFRPVRPVSPFPTAVKRTEYLVRMALGRGDRAGRDHIAAVVPIDREPGRDYVRVTALRIGAVVTIGIYTIVGGDGGEHVDRVPMNQVESTIQFL